MHGLTYSPMLPHLLPHAAACTCACTLQVLSAYAILDYLTPASVCILSKTQQAYLYCKQRYALSPPLANLAVE